MGDNQDSEPRNGLIVTVELSAGDVERLDAWIAEQPEPRPSRAVALRRLAELGIDHGREVEITRRHIAQADRDIRAKFDEVTEVLKLAAAHVADDGEGQKRH